MIVSYKDLPVIIGVSIILILLDYLYETILEIIYDLKDLLRMLGEKDE